MAERFGGYREEHSAPHHHHPETDMATSGDYIVEAVWGRSCGEHALVYSIPLGTWWVRDRKRIRKSEWVQAARRLTTACEFTREWFEQFMPVCNNDGTENFTTIGGIFVPLKYAVDERGRYPALPSYEGEDGEGCISSKPRNVHYVSFFQASEKSKT